MAPLDEERERQEMEKVRDEAQKIQPGDLPIGFYVVTRDGKFVECNWKVRQILELPLEGEIDASIVDFFQDPRKREHLIEILQKNENQGNVLEKQVIPFKVGKREIFVQDHCRLIRDPDTNEIIGFIGCLVDMTEEENYRRLFDSLPAGVYRLDKEDKIKHVNPSVVKMLGYDSEQELIGKSVKELYANLDEFLAFEQMIKKNGYVVDRRVGLLKKDEQTIFTSVNAFSIIDSNGNYAGREGTLTDVTSEERYHRILTDVQVGFYMVRKENGEDIIRHCNKQFAEMFEFDKEEDVIGFKIKDLYSNSEDYPRFQELIKKQDQINKPLIGYSLRVKTRKGRNIVIEVNARAQHDRNNRIIGRAGVVRDITQEFALREQVKEFTLDIGNVLHAYSSTLISVQHSIWAVICSLGHDPFPRERALLIDRELEALQEPTANLIFSLNRLNEVVTARSVSDLIQQNLWLELQHSHEKLTQVKNIPYQEFRLPTLRETVQHIIDICQKIEVVKQIQDMVQQVRDSAEELLRICSLINLHQARDAIIAIGQQVRSLREYVTFGARKTESPAPLRIGKLVMQATTNMDEFAYNRGVTIKTNVNFPNIQVLVVERDVVRALTNLLHNAIKYSWSRKKGEPPWILIRSLIDRDNQMSIEVENFGVPIPKEEISQDLIFQIGYRGRLSSDRGRMGTGVGLSDSRRVAREYGGNMIIKSRPAFPGRRDDDYTQPFLTTAVFSLPIFTR